VTTLCVPTQDVPAAIRLFQKVAHVIEVGRCTEGTRFLDSSSEGIVLEGRGTRVATGYDSLSRAAFEVPRVLSILHVAQSVAVCVVSNCGRRRHT
jgi:hypothetical protein